MAFKEENDIKGWERIFNILGWLGFIAIIPVALKVFGVTRPQLFLEENLGRYGSTGFLLLIFFVLIGIRVIFGSGRIIVPLIIASLSGFVFISVASGVKFMNWLYEAAVSTRFFDNMPLNFIVGVVVLLMGIVASYSKKFPFVLQILLLVLLPVGFIAICGATGFLGGLGAVELGSGT